MQETSLKCLFYLDQPFHFLHGYGSIIVDIKNSEDLGQNLLRSSLIHDEVDYHELRKVNISIIVGVIESEKVFFKVWSSPSTWFLVLRYSVKICPTVTSSVREKYTDNTLAKSFLDNPVLTAAIDKHTPVTSDLLNYQRRLPVAHLCNNNRRFYVISRICVIVWINKIMYLNFGTSLY